MDYSMHDAFVLGQLVRDFAEASLRGEILSLRDFGERSADGSIGSDRVLCYVPDRASMSGAMIPVMSGFASSVCTTYDELLYTVKVRLVFSPSGRPRGFAGYARESSVDDERPVFVWLRRDDRIAMPEADAVPDPFGAGLLYEYGTIM